MGSVSGDGVRGPSTNPYILWEKENKAKGVKYGSRAEKSKMWAEYKSTNNVVLKQDSKPVRKVLSTEEKLVRTSEREAKLIERQLRDARLGKGKKL